MDKLNKLITEIIQAAQNFVPLFLLVGSALYFIKFGFTLGQTWGYLVCAIVMLALAYLFSVGGDNT